jgi:hypothetical protein
VAGFDTPKALAKAMAKAADEVRGLDEASAELGATLVSLSRRLTPNRSGNLRASIAFRIARPTKKADTQVNVTAGGAAIKYAQPIHWGWPKRGIKPSLFLTDALGRMADHDVIDKAYADKVSEILTKALG